ncbi:MAG: hypothetical protein ABJP45_12955 [Cyclobacteriaceae bacterium]
MLETFGLFQREEEQQIGSALLKEKKTSRNLSRYRVKQKLGLAENDDLVAYVQTF